MLFRFLNFFLMRFYEFSTRTYKVSEKILSELHGRTNRLANVYYYVSSILLFDDMKVLQN